MKLFAKFLYLFIFYKVNPDRNKLLKKRITLYYNRFANE
jgi:hypothetical protein